MTLNSRTDRLSGRLPDQLSDIDSGLNNIQVDPALGFAIPLIYER